MNQAHNMQADFFEQPNWEVPDFPSVIRYHDEFLDKVCTIHSPAKSDVWKISHNGRAEYLDFRFLGVEIRPLLKHWCCNQLQSLSVGSARTNMQRLQEISQVDLVEILKSTPKSVRTIWNSTLAKEYSIRIFSALKNILYYFCKFSMNGWSNQYEEFLSTLPLPFSDKYANLRTGDVFLAVEEEAVLVSHFDRLSQKITDTHLLVHEEDLRDTAVLICSFQFGLRPMQIGMLRLRDVRIWKEVDDEIPAVHLTFKMIKQRSSAKALPLPRRVKREWAPIFVALYERAKNSDMKATDHFFSVTSAQETSQIILRITGRLLPEPRSATDLRHTAAQRLVDAGANQEELAEFMGHSDVETGLIYFQTSANQAERVNKALGISQVYTQVAKIAHDRFIGQEELDTLKGDQQIGAVPHGIPIAGIGACSTGQPSCPSNPVMACYGCFKFMPLNDPEIHKQVLADFRSVVKFFSDSSKEERNSPAHMQLQRTISNVQSVIAELEEDSNE